MDNQNLLKTLKALENIYAQLEVIKVSGADNVVAQASAFIQLNALKGELTKLVQNNENDGVDKRTILNNDSIAYNHVDSTIEREDGGGDE